MALPLVPIAILAAGGVTVYALTRPKTAAAAPAPGTPGTPGALVAVGSTVPTTASASSPHFPAELQPDLAAMLSSPVADPGMLGTVAGWFDAYAFFPEAAATRARATVLATPKVSGGRHFVGGRNPDGSWQPLPRFGCESPLYMDMQAGHSTGNIAFSGGKYFTGGLHLNGPHPATWRAAGSNGGWGGLYHGIGNHSPMHIGHPAYYGTPTPHLHPPVFGGFGGIGTPIGQAHRQSMHDMPRMPLEEPPMPRRPGVNFGRRHHLAGSSYAQNPGVAWAGTRGAYADPTSDRYIGTRGSYGTDPALFGCNANVSAHIGSSYRFLTPQDQIWGESHAPALFAGARNTMRTGAVAPLTQAQISELRGFMHTAAMGQSGAAAGTGTGATGPTMSQATPQGGSLSALAAASSAPAPTSFDPSYRYPPTIFDSTTTSSRFLAAVLGR